MSILLASPLWLKLAVVLAVAMLAAFPAALRWVIGTEAGRALALGVLAILVVCFFRQHAFAAGRAAEHAERTAKVQAERLAAAKREVELIAHARQADERARIAVDEATRDIQTRLKRAEGIARAKRPPVPAVCPDPDPDLVRELADARQRITARADELRNLRRAEAGRP